MDGLGSMQFRSAPVEPFLFCGVLFFVTCLFYYLKGNPFYFFQLHAFCKNCSAACQGKKVACATVCHSKSSAQFVGGILANKVFSMARNKEFQIAGFPDFAGTLSDLKQYRRTPQPNYEVCVATGEGHLVITEALVSFWCVKHSQFSSELEKIKSEHDKEFNPKGLKRGHAETEEVGDDETEEQPTKRLCLATLLSAEEMDSKHSERTVSCLRCAFVMVMLCLTNIYLILPVCCWFAGSS